jgi:hypothetical protein
MQRSTILAATPLLLALNAGIMAGCEGDPTIDDDSAMSDDDDDAMDPGGQIEGPTSLDLGDVMVGGSSESALQFDNTGVQPLLIEDIMIVGEDAAVFTTDFAGEISVPASQGVSYVLHVQFTPTEAVDYEATIVVISSAFNAGAGQWFSATLRGQGFVDEDGDGYPWGEGYDADDLDCDDGNADAHPGATEQCNGVDDDCDGGVDNLSDGDGDGALVCGDHPDCDDGDPDAHPAWVSSSAQGGDGTQAAPFGSIQDALDSDHCGLFLLTGGVYQEGQTLEVLSGPVTLHAVDGVSSAEIDGWSTHPILRIWGGPATRS